jgi:hypothetical protein
MKTATDPPPSSTPHRHCQLHATSVDEQLKALARSHDSPATVAPFSIGCGALDGPSFTQCALNPARFGVL